MESAIPQHLRTERTRHRRVEDDYNPPYPSFVARHKPAVERVVMAYFGLQYRADADPAVTSAARQALDGIAGAFGNEHGPGHWDRARYVDEADCANVLSIAYWDDPLRFDRWLSAHGRAWTARGEQGGPIGYFIEVLRPAVERYETLFSANDRAEGIAVLADGMSDVILEHAYWGGMRDRIPLSQTDAMTAVGAPRVVTEGLRKQVVPHQNICLIRSGQDWGDTGADERKLYLDTVEPVLHEGMDFLRDDGLKIGCYANRYMQVIDVQGNAIEKSFGMSWWQSLSALERWSESHPTHVAIFGAAMRYLSALGPAAKLKLYHEVSVAATDEQLFEYVNCHERTGMLKA